ncbi:hypothetical protein OH77DRAFT_1197665 [Trametes cingulata]|nr:hypothetical protein OH77DRAFT_1197665 [Trametes cingulata]
MLIMPLGLLPHLQYITLHDHQPYTRRRSKKQMTCERTTAARSVGKISSKRKPSRAQLRPRAAIPLGLPSLRAAFGPPLARQPSARRPSAPMPIFPPRKSRGTPYVASRHNRLKPDIIGTALPQALRPPKHRQPIREHANGKCDGSHR